MALRSFAIEDHRALSLVECDDPPDLMVIAGPNGVGKSTLLHQLHTGIRTYNPSQPNRGQGPRDISCNRDTQSVYFSPHRVPGNNSEFNRGDLLEGRRTTFRSLMSDDQNFPNVPRNLPTQRDPRGPDATAFRGLSRRMAEFTEQRRTLALDLIDDGASVKKEDLPDVEKPLGELIDRVIPGISLVGVEENNDNYQLRFQNRSDEIIGLEDLSSGEIDIITMLFFVAEQQIENKIEKYTDNNQNTNDDQVVLIDGPESYLHPYLQLQFIEFISEYIEERSNVQVILVTHSEIILNHTRKENLWYLTYPDMVSGNQLRSADEINIDLLENILGEIGTSALAAGKPLLLVEGDSDREVLTRLYPDLRDSMTILPMEGKPNIVQLEEVFDKLVPNFLETGIQLHAIVDGDRLSDNLSSNYIHQLPVANIENVLLQPEALFETINSLGTSRKIESKGIRSPEDVKELLHEIVSRRDIKREEIRLRVNEEMNFEIGLGASEDITKQNVRDRFDEVVTANRTRIEEKFEEIESEIETAANNNNMGKFDGKRIINEIATEFDLRGNSIRLLTAENIQQRNLHPDNINDIINNIKSELDQ